MPQHLFLPKQSLKDVRALIRLEDRQLRALGELLGASQSVSLDPGDFAHLVAERLGLGQDAASSVALVGQFLLTVVEKGHPPEEIIDDVREFLDQYPEERALVANLDANRDAFVSTLTPKPERSRALKVRYLQDLYPNVESFRTVCELRPVFADRADGEEEIVGYVPAILLRMTQSNPDGTQSHTAINVSPASLRSLAEVIERTERKLAVIRQRFGDNLLGDLAQEKQS